MASFPTGSFGGVVPRRMPESYIRAEVAAFPLVSLTAFRLATTELSPSLSAREARSGEEMRAAQDTQELWRDCEHSLSEHASGWSLDRLITLRDRFWFDSPPARSLAHSAYGEALVPIHEYLNRLAQQYLSSWPGVSEVAHRTELEALDATTHYRWLTFSLPEDLLLAAIDVEPDEAPPLRVSMEPPVLVRRLLDDGVTDIHHHVNAGMDFPLLWVSLLAELRDVDPNSLQSPGLAFPSGEVLLRWMLAAAIARSVLGEFLMEASETDGLGFFGYLTGPSFRGQIAWRAGRRATLHRALRALGSGKDSVLPGFYELRSLYRAIHPRPMPPWTPRRIAEVWREFDPIAKRLSLGAPNGGEHWFVRHALSYIKLRGRCGPAERNAEADLEDCPRPDAMFTRIFWQIIRLRCTFYRTLVQRPMTAGLQWFIRFYDRLYPARIPLHAVRSEISFEVAGQHESIGAMEVRTGPRPTASDTASELLDLVRSWKRVLRKHQRRGTREPEFGVLFHLVKERDPDKKWTGGAPPAFGAGTHAEPAPHRLSRRGGRFAAYFSARAQEVRALASLIEARPILLWLVRGFDVAADELSVPNWVLVPLYRYIHRRSASASAATSSQGAPPLGLTAHVGEDFCHLMDGLRRVYECIHYIFSARISGGRLGHAVALGVEPRSWAESAGTVMLPAEERLWNLIFEWRLYSAYHTPGGWAANAAPGRVRQVENDIRELTCDIFGSSYEPALMAEVHHILHQIWSPPIALDEIRPGQDAFARGLRHIDTDRVRDSRRVRRIIERYRTDDEVFCKGQIPRDVRLTDLEIEALYHIQDSLRDLVGELGFAVEVNPSSNLLIANLMDLRNHPILRLYPPELQEGAPAAVPIAVGADDPLTFGTSLLREYSLLHETARTAGYSERTVHEWLARIRQTSMDARFTRPWAPSALTMANRLIGELEHYLQQPRRSFPGVPQPRGL